VTKAEKKFYRELGARVRGQRTRRGLTQQALGERLSPKKTRAGVCNIEKGSHRVAAYTIVQIAAVLGPAVMPTKMRAAG
jgi:transcriptional regulator with XRE-family HTH domain